MEYHEAKSQLEDQSPIDPEDLYRYLEKKRTEFPKYIETEEEKEAWREAMAYVQFEILHRHVGQRSF